jgi:hypothetical protein
MYYVFSWLVLLSEGVLGGEPSYISLRREFLGGNATSNSLPEGDWRRK